MRARPFIITGLVVVVVYMMFVLASGLGLNPTGTSWNFETVGQLGDAFGPLNTLMAGLAAVGAIGAYLAQAEELEEAKTNARKERSSADRRDFEATFFRLVELFRDTANEIEVSDRYNQNPVSGRDAVKRLLDDGLRGPKGNDEEDAENWQKTYLAHRDDLGHYFRIFYQIVRFVDESEIENKALYIRVLRASLSNAEIIILALNCCYGEGRRKFKPLVEKYALLHNISEYDAKNWRFHEIYDSSAFGERSRLVARV